MSAPEVANTPAEAPKKPSLRTVLGDQKRVLVVALCLAAAGFWILGPMGDWDVATFLAVGILLGLANHVATEYSLLKMISSGHDLTRGEITASALVRLLFITGVAAAVAIVFWSTGIVALIGLALFRLITLVMTSIPLLKELSKA